MGRAALPTQLKDNAWPIGPSAIAAEGKVYTSAGAEPYVVPEAMKPAQLKATVGHYAEAARRARAAGFDGIELHGANGYLIDQFLRDGSNQRDDAYGGSVENRFRFLSDVIEAVLAHWPANRIGVRLSPTNPFQGMSDSDPVKHFTGFARALNRFRIAYLHVVENPVQPEGRPEVARHLRDAYEGAFIVAEGFDRQSAERWLENGWADLIAFGKAFLANPDLVERLWSGAELNAPDKATFYTAGPEGYIDYPALGANAERRSGA
jgi:N-ethylmaleimide reductase